MIKACIFDLDGVLTDTAKFHYLAWKAMAKTLDYNLTEADNEKLKGVSRLDSLLLIQEWAGVKLPQTQIEELLEMKNQHYLVLIEDMSPTDVFEGVIDLFKSLKDNGIKIALGSSSKNALYILNKLEIKHWFDVISDGNNVSKSKPDPEVFLYASEKLKIAPQYCVVFEDAPAGVQAAINAKMNCIGIGNPDLLVGVQCCLKDLKDFDYKKLSAVPLLNY